MDNTSIDIPLDPIVVEALRRWRLEEARRQGVPAYWIITNRNIAELATHLPTNLTDLAKIRGMGLARIDRYGEAILEIMRENAGRSQEGKPPDATPDPGEAEVVNRPRRFRARVDVPTDKQKAIAQILGVEEGVVPIEVTLKFC